MGLDMYLTKKVYVGANYDHNKISGKVSLKKDGKPIHVNQKKITYINENAAYWRKENHIHRWFVENVQDGEDDCKAYYVERDQLKKLVDTCKEVLADHSKAETLLPTQSGFFFGGTEYDECYFDGLKSTIEQLEAALENSDDAEFEYQSSW